MKQRKSLKQLLEEQADLDLLSTKDALEVVRRWLISEPTRAMILQEDGLTVHLVSKKSLLNQLSQPQTVSQEKGTAPK